MSSESRAGRPKASSRETLAEAACELFLEQGYEQTSIVEITRRAGVSRSSFFNYFSSKAEILWAGLDERIADVTDALRSQPDHESMADAATDVHAALLRLGAGFAPDSLALALVNPQAMGIEEELEREASLRRSRIARAIADRLAGAGMDRLHAEVAAAAYGGAVLAALQSWAHDGAGRAPLDGFLPAALSIARAVAESALPAAGSIRQMRVVVQAPAFEEALAFYRDTVGMPQREAFEADGGARVVILDAGRATLELANTAQVAFIDRIETDGGSSDRIRIALEVDDTAAAAQRWEAAGARVEASARLTPWRSINARLRGAADLQLTAFQELGEAPGPDA